RRAVKDVESGDVEGDAGQLRRVEVVVDDGRDGHLVAVAEEARHGEANDQVLANDDAVHGPTGARVKGDAADRGTPRRERVWKLKLSGGMTGGIGDNRSLPVRGVRESFADVGLDEVAALDLREGAVRMGAKFRQWHGAGPGFAME